VALLFPDGRLLSPRWRPVAWLSALSIMLTCGIYGVLLWPLRAVVDRDPFELLTPGQAIVINAAFPFMVLCGLACLTALALRFRRARGIERQQLKWLLFAAAITVVIVTALSGPVSRLWVLPLGPAIPVAAGIAILRYRLYDIDRIISRTLVYGLLTALLAAVYAGLVLGLEELFGGIGAEPPSWGVAGATLTVAALFQPVRRRIQAVVDRSGRLLGHAAPHPLRIRASRALFKPKTTFSQITLRRNWLCPIIGRTRSEPAISSNPEGGASNYRTTCCSTCGE
jgi:hypothetical protein